MSISGEIRELNPALYMCVNDPYIHVEDASSVIRDLKELREQTFFNESNPYKELSASLESLAAAADIDLSEKMNAGRGFINDTTAVSDAPLLEIEKELDLDIYEAQYLIKAQTEKLKSHKEEISAANNLIRENRIILGQLDHIGDVSANLDALFKFEFFKFRFGHMPREAYDFIALYGMADMDDVFFIPSYIEKNEVWGIYFTPRTKSLKVDSMFSVLHFERVRISDKAHGTPELAKIELSKEIDAIAGRINELNAGLAGIISETNELLEKYYEKIYMLFNIYELKKKTVRSSSSFHLIVWLPENHAGKFSKKLSRLSTAVLSVNSPSDVPYIKPPTLLRNFLPFRPFEQFVKMYGLPAYGETDPTPFLALTYILFFGIMFADVGQGLIISLFGFLIWRFRRINLGRIAGILGLSSIFFGCFFGSVFGLEDVIRGYSAMEHMNTVLIAAVGLGVAAVSGAIIINIINGVKQKNIEKILFSQNGLAGLIFYWSVIIAGLVMMKFVPLNISLPVVISLVVLCVLIIYLKEPLTNLMRRKARIIPYNSNPGEFFVVSLFELFEIVLSFLTNTISFIRVGAFALNHIGMMSVVMLLAETSSGSKNLVVLVIGNIIVIALEGLIVGIQCLRLQYYEIFGKFFEGDGKSFEPSEFAGKKYKNKRGL